MTNESNTQAQEFKDTPPRLSQAASLPNNFDPNHPRPDANQFVKVVPRKGWEVAGP